MSGIVRKKCFVNCCYGNIGMCLLCGKNLQYKRANVLLSGAVRYNFFFNFVLVNSVFVHCARNTESCYERN